MGIAGRTRMESLFDRNQIVKAYEEEIRNILEQKEK
jgi:hypothetical protein